MALLVQKFGGTSVATLAHINHAADIVAKAKHAGHSVVVVVSAMGGETDRLIGLAHQMSESPDPREYAALISTGEQVSMALMTMALINRGIAARSYTGIQAKIKTDSQFKKARIQTIDTESIEKDLVEGSVVVVAGFQGVDKHGNITTLGRGGSDTTAVALASALKADECQIFTDVDGVYTTDPRVVPDAKRLDQITFEEMLELSSLGAKVLQIRAVEFAGKYKVPLRVLSSSKEGPGTLITYKDQDNMEGFSVTGIAFSRNETKISIIGVPDAPGLASKIFAEISSIGVNVDTILQHVSGDNHKEFTFTVHRDEYQPTLQLLNRIAQEISAKAVHGTDKLAKLSLVGAGLKSHPEVAPIMFKILANSGINIQVITTSEIKISVVIEESQLDAGVKALHHAFLTKNLFDESRVMPPIAS
jgi:aspartate kinase